MNQINLFLNSETKILNLNNPIKSVIKLIGLLLIFIPFLLNAQTHDLTGFWQSDIGACYQIRQIGNEVVWVDEPNINSWAYNAFYGLIAGNSLTGKWYDMPSNPQNNFGESLAFRIENNTKMVKISESKSYNGSVLTKLNGTCDSNNPQVTDQVTGNGSLYFFKGGEYISYDIGSDKIVSGYPKSISSSTWNGVWTSGIDAAVNAGNGKIYFFKGSEYIRFDIASDKADAGYPLAISSSTWNGVWTSGIDAAVNGGNGKIYFFKGSQYIRFDIASDKADEGYPQAISSSTWNGMWTSGVDAAVNAGNGKIYFFKGNEYIRFDITSDRADPGYPQPITNWKLPWDKGIEAATIIN